MPSAWGIVLYGQVKKYSNRFSTVTLIASPTRDDAMNLPHRDTDGLVPLLCALKVHRWFIR